MEVPREELDPPYDIKLVLCSKLHFFLGKSTKKLLPPELHFLTPICTKSFVGWALPQTPLGELTALPQTPSCIMGHIYKEERGGKRRKGRRGRREEERVGSEFVLCPRKKKEKSAAVCQNTSSVLTAALERLPRVSGRNFTLTQTHIHVIDMART